MVTIAFTGGGSGGHIYPGLALVPLLWERLALAGEPVRIFWIGSASGMDGSIIREAGLEFFGVPAGKLRRQFSVRTLVDCFKVAAGFFAARRILRREKPALLFSKGGFVSVPPCVAAASLGIPVLTHESDYSPGLATRINARFALKILAPYPETRAFFREKLRGRVIVTGNPIRGEFQAARPAQGRAFLGLEAGERILLVLGGSQGAREINGLIREALSELTKHYVVVHQTGPGGGEAAPAGERYRAYPFIKEALPHIIAASELVVCRCGANTLWECASLGRPLILIPLRGAGTRGDQVENARLFEEAGLGIRLQGEGSPAEQLVRAVAALASSGERRAAMAAAALRLVSVDGAARIVAELTGVLENGGGAGGTKGPLSREKGGGPYP
jgi:UDP-N-acetylglucosamine--N-acetylmuramyl-(pentapeptide) pyrophosphoryl-undecaprenol N-acetylglucosamine transferase